MSKDHIDKDDTNEKANKSKDNNTFSEFTLNDFDDAFGLKQQGEYDKPCSPFSEIFADENDSTGTDFQNDFNMTFPKTNDLGDIAPATQDFQNNQHDKKVKPKKREFNPWHELDKVSKKNMSRRDLLRGVFRFLPKDKEGY